MVTACVRPSCDYELRVDVDDETAGIRLPDALEFAVYRVVRELLENGAKHSGAGRAFIRIAPQGGELLVGVEDQGVGFVPDANQSLGAKAQSIGSG